MSHETRAQRRAPRAMTRERGGERHEPRAASSEASTTSHNARAQRRAPLRPTSLTNLLLASLALSRSWTATAASSQVRSRTLTSPCPP
jgi:hypothetical protein